MKKLTMEELSARLAAIDALPAEQPTESDLAAIAAAVAEHDPISLTEYRQEKEYSGNLMLRIPKELHRSLAKAAKENGVSLNQYALYKLAK